MADPWYPGAIQHAGAHAKYERGRIPHVVTVVGHYTVGVNSIGTLGRDFQFLVDRDGDVHQGAPVDAVCWHAGMPWNTLGPGIEIEYHPAYDDVDGDGPEDTEIMTEAQVRSAHDLVLWLHAEWGVPLEWYDGPRVTSWNGFIAHRALIQSGAWHHDYWPEIYAALIFFGMPPTKPAPEPPAVKPWEDSEMIALYFNPETKKLVALAPNGVGQIFFAEQDSDGNWSAWREVAQGSFAVPVRQL